MKKLFFSLVIAFGITLFMNGCYTYLALSDGAQLADVPPEPYYPPFPPPPPPGPPGHPDPSPRPIIVIINPLPEHPKQPYERPKEISDIRNGGEGRIPDQNDRRR